MRCPAIVVILVICAVLTTSCSNSAAERPPGATSNPGAPVSPLGRITDPLDDTFVSRDPDVRLDQRGRGPSRFSVARGTEDSGFGVYVACGPSATYTVRVGTADPKSMSGMCEQEFQNFGEFPLAGSEDPVEVELDLPQDVDYWVVILPKRE